jgi:hypothetical protein
MLGVGGGHKVEESAGHSYPGTGLEVGGTRASVGEGFFQRIYTFFHRQQLGHLLFVKE